MKAVVFALPAFAACLVAGDVGTARAQSADTYGSGMPRSAFFIGGGVGYAFGNFGNQSVYNKGISDTYQDGVKVASGTADGPPVNVGLDDESGVVPTVQFGYFQHLGNTDWLLGVKFSYGYLGLTSTTQNLIIPQFGTSSSVAAPTFTGYSVTRSYSVEVRHQVMSLLYAGRSFGNGFVYAGAGPSFSQIKVELDDVVGFATLNGVLTNVSGTPQSFASTDWRVGAVMTVGVTYFLTPSWFVDVSYLLNIPEARTARFQSAFNNPGNPDSFAGSLIGTATANMQNTQTIMLSLNKAF
jgi:opacity protein-like surface antigen